MGKLTDAQKRAKAKYNKKAYRRAELILKPPVMNILNSHCNKIGSSKNGFISQAIQEKIERDTGKTFNELLEEAEHCEMQSDDIQSSLGNLSF